jgi:hypothetical protein
MLGELGLAARRDVRTGVLGGRWRGMDAGLPASLSSAMHICGLGEAWSRWGLEQAWVELKVMGDGQVLEEEEYHRRKEFYIAKGQRHYYFMNIGNGEVIDACRKVRDHPVGDLQFATLPVSWGRVAWEAGWRKGRAR